MTLSFFATSIYVHKKIVFIEDSQGFTFKAIEFNNFDPFSVNSPYCHVA